MQLLSYMFFFKTPYGILTDGVLFLFIYVRRDASFPGGQEEPLALKACCHFGMYNDEDYAMVKQLLYVCQRVSRLEGKVQWPAMLKEALDERKQRCEHCC